MSYSCIGYVLITTTIAVTCSVFQQQRTAKQNGVTSLQLLHFYTRVIRPVLQYASPLWHPTLTKSQSERLEAVQRRAIIIIFVRPTFVRPPSPDPSG